MMRLCVASMGVVVFLFGVLALPTAAEGAYLVINVRVDTDNTYGLSPHTVYAINWDDVYNPDNADVEYVYNSSSLWGTINVAANNDPDLVLAKIHNLHITVKADPIVELGFDVEALFDADIQISADILTFDAITNPIVEAGASINVTEGSIAGNWGDGYAYRAFYLDGNGDPVEFADLIDTNAGLPFTDSSGSQQISDSVTGIYGEWNFSLSAGGRAEGSAPYTATAIALPEPASLLLLALGGTVLLRKRKL